MQHESALAVLLRLSAPSLGVFRGAAAAESGVSRKQVARLRVNGMIERLLPDTYRIVAVVPRSVRATDPGVLVRHSVDRNALMVRRLRGIPAAGIECTLVQLAGSLDDEAFEIACEDARRRRLTSVPALHAYLDRFGTRGRPGVAPMRRLLRELDPVHAARSTLEVKTRRLLVAHRIHSFTREFPLEWGGRTYRYDFAFPAHSTILETNGRRWHDDASDYEHDQEKWSVPGRHGYRIVFATWDKITRQPEQLLRELAATMAA